MTVHTHSTIASYKKAILTFTQKIESKVLLFQLALALVRAPIILRSSVIGYSKTGQTKSRGLNFSMECPFKSTIMAKLLHRCLKNSLLATRGLFKISLHALPCNFQSLKSLVASF